LKFLKDICREEVEEGDVHAERAQIFSYVRYVVPGNGN
jgi:hypothetical protein